MNSMPNGNITPVNVDTNQPNNITTELSKPNLETNVSQPLPNPEVKVTPPVPSTSSPQQALQQVPVVQNHPANIPAQSVHTDSATSRDMHLQSVDQLTAGDTKLIEKEWVDKTEEIIDKTKDDPYNEDEQQHHLSRTYLKKRFNLDVK